MACGSSIFHANAEGRMSALSTMARKVAQLNLPIFLAMNDFV